MEKHECKESEGKILIINVVDDKNICDYCGEEIKIEELL